MEGWVWRIGDRDRIDSDRCGDRDRIDRVIDVEIEIE